MGASTSPTCAEIGNHISQYYQIVEARHGRFLVNPRDKYIGRSLITYGEWGEAEVRLFDKLLRPGDVAVEVGSNIGSHTIPISKMVGTEGTVHAFEPQRLINQVLCANVALNDCINVHVERMAISDYIGQIMMCNVYPSADFNYGSASINQLYDYNSVVEPCKISTIDEFNFPKVDFIKIDAEGEDCKVLMGAKKNNFTRQASHIRRSK